MGLSRKERKWARRRELFEKRGQPPIWFWNIWRKLTKQLLEKFDIDLIRKELDKIIKELT